MNYDVYIQILMQYIHYNSYEIYVTKGISIKNLGFQNVTALKKFNRQIFQFFNHLKKEMSTFFTELSFMAAVILMM